MSSDPSQPLESALALVQFGWAVFPLQPKSKKPATEHGFKDASKDPKRIENLFTGGTDFNIGIATGKSSGVWVLDIDGPAGQHQLQSLERHYGSLPTTVSSRTGGGGRHLFFRCGSVAIGSPVRVGGLAIDVRGEGACVVVPPSIHPSGGEYAWENPPDRTALAEAPHWLVDWVSKATSGVCSLSSHVRMELDLGTDQGAREGFRHTRAAKLIGAELARGSSYEVVLDLAVRWAMKCEPPFPKAEVVRIVEGLNRKEAEKRAEETDALEKIPLLTEQAWPVLDEAAYYGLAGEIVRTIEPETEADPAALLIQLLVSVGNLFGRSAHFKVEGTPHYTNLFAILVGATATGRKGTSMERVRQVLRGMDEDWEREQIQNGLVSGEGLIWSVRDAIFKQEPIRENKNIVGYQDVEADPGVTDKRLLVLESEFASVLRVFRREQNTLSPTIRSAWDSGHLRTMAKNSPAKATNAHISIVGHITKEELIQGLAEVESFNGFSNRFLWAVVHQSKLLPDGGQDLDLSRFIEPLSRACAVAKQTERMRRDSSARTLWHDIYGELSLGAPGALGAATNRAAPQVLRLSLIYALLDGSAAILPCHLRAALAVWRYCRHSAELLFQPFSGDRLADQLLNLIRKSPGINRRGMYQSLGNHVKADDLVEALSLLRDNGLAYPLVEETAGRPAERWFPAHYPVRTNEQSPGEQGPDCEQSPGEQGPDCEQSEQSEQSSGSEGLSSLCSHVRTPPVNSSDDQDMENLRI